MISLNNIIIYYYSKFIFAFVEMYDLYHVHRPKKDTENRPTDESVKTPILFFVVFNPFQLWYDIQTFLQEKFLMTYKKNLHSHCIHQPEKKNLGNFCKLYPRDNWFDWNETKIWGNIEKWERAKVRSVDKTTNKISIDWKLDHTLHPNS